MTTQTKPDLLQRLTDYMSYTLKPAAITNNQWLALVQRDPALALRAGAADAAAAAGRLFEWGQFLNWVGEPGHNGLTQRRMLEYVAGVLGRAPRQTHDPVEDARAAGEFDVQRKIALFLLSHIISAMEG